MCFGSCPRALFSCFGLSSTFIVQSKTCDEKGWFATLNMTYILPLNLQSISVKVALSYKAMADLLPTILESGVKCQKWDLRNTVYDSKQDTDWNCKSLTLFKSSDDTIDSISSEIELWNIVENLHFQPAPLFWLNSYNVFLNGFVYSKWFVISVLNIPFSFLCKHYSFL